MLFMLQNVTLLFCLLKECIREVITQAKQVGLLMLPFECDASSSQGYLNTPPPPTQDLALQLLEENEQSDLGN